LEKSPHRLAVTELVHVWHGGEQGALRFQIQALDDLEETRTPL
jgi:hypothetical protein